MAAYGGIATGAATGDVTSIDTDSLNVSGADLTLIAGASESVSSARTFTPTWDPTTNSEAMTGTFATLAPGAYLNTTLQYLDNPTAVNGVCRFVLSGAASDITVMAVFFTAAGDIVGTDTANQTATGGSTSKSATVPNVVSGDMVIDWVSIGQQNTLTIGANQTSRINPLDSGAYLRSAVSTQAGADGGVMSWTYPNANYGSAIIAARIPDAGGGGGGLTIPIAVHHMNQMRS